MCERESTLVSSLTFHMPAPIRQVAGCTLDRSPAFSYNLQILHQISWFCGYLSKCLQAQKMQMNGTNELHLISCYFPVPCALNLFLLLSLGQRRLQGVQVSPQLMQFPL